MKLQIGKTYLDVNGDAHHMYFADIEGLVASDIDGKPRYWFQATGKYIYEDFSHLDIVEEVGLREYPPELLHLLIGKKLRHKEDHNNTGLIVWIHNETALMGGVWVNPNLLFKHFEQLNGDVWGPCGIL